MHKSCSQTIEPTVEEVESALAAVIANTRRARRPLNLLEVAQKIETASRGVGGVRKLADHVGISEQMARDFLSVKTLVPEVQELIAARKIDSVDIASRIARLPEEDQLPIAREAVSRHLDGRDVRAVLALRKALHNVSIDELMKRVVESRNIREYVAEFIIPPDVSDLTVLEARFAQIVGNRNIRRLELSGRLVQLAMNSEGYSRLQETARQQRITKRELIDRLAKEEGPRYAQRSNRA